MQSSTRAHQLVVTGDDDAQASILKLGAACTSKDLLHVQHACVAKKSELGHMSHRHPQPQPQASWCPRVGVPDVEMEVSEKPQHRTEVLKLAALRIVQLRALDDDCVRGQVHAPRQGGRCAQHLVKPPAVVSGRRVWMDAEPIHV